MKPSLMLGLACLGLISCGPSAATQKPKMTTETPTGITAPAGKGWFPILRLYGPLEPWFNKTWRPGEIEPSEERYSL